MERARDGYRGRYRDRHYRGDSTDRRNFNHRSTRGHYREPQQQFINEEKISQINGRHSSRTSPIYSNSQSSRSSVNSRPVLSRNGPSAHYRPSTSDTYSPPHIPSSISSRSGSAASSQINYHDSHLSLSRSMNDRDIYSSLSDDELMLSETRPSYYESERDQYSSSSSSIPSYRSSISRFDRPMEYPSRSSDENFYEARGDYHSRTTSSAHLSVQIDPYGDAYRTNDYRNRYETRTIRVNPSATSIHYRSNEIYRNPPTRDDSSYRPSSESRNSNSSPMEYQMNSSRNHRSSTNGSSSSHFHSNLKRSASRQNDYEIIPSKRSFRR